MDRPSQIMPSGIGASSATILPALKVAAAVLALRAVSAAAVTVVSVIESVGIGGSGKMGALCVQDGRMSTKEGTYGLQVA